MSNQQYNLMITLLNSEGDEIPLSSENVISLTITESILSLIPKMVLIITNTGGFVDRTPITDKMVVYVKISSNVDDIPIVNNKFIISSFYAESDHINHGFLVYNISAYLAIDEWLSPFKNTAYRGSSDEVIKDVCHNIGYKFDGRANGVDNNTWIQFGNNFQFINHIAERSFIDGDGVFVYGTMKNMVYTSLGTEAHKERAKIAKYDKGSGLETAPLGKDKLHMFYNGYNIMNNVEMYNNVALYGGTYSYYDMTENVSTDLSYNPAHKVSSLYNTSKKYVEDKTFNKYIGMITDKKLFNTIYSGKIQNAFYKHALFSNTMLLNINSYTDVNLFDLIDLELPSTLDPSELSNSYSGKYFIGAITYNITRDIPISKRVLLCRAGINSGDKMVMRYEDIV